MGLRRGAHGRLHPLEGFESCRVGPPCLCHHTCRSLLGSHPHLLPAPWGLQESLLSQRLPGLLELYSPDYRPRHHASLLPVCQPLTDILARRPLEDCLLSSLLKGLQLPHGDAVCPLAALSPSLSLGEPVRSSSPSCLCSFSDTPIPRSQS